MDNVKWRCRRCGEALVEDKVVFEYLDHTVANPMLRCPKCGLVLVPADIAEGKMAETETMLEDK